MKTALDVQAPLIDEPILYGHNVHLKVETDAAAVIGKTRYCENRKGK